MYCSTKFMVSSVNIVNINRPETLFRDTLVRNKIYLPFYDFQTGEDENKKKSRETGRIVRFYRIV